LRGIYQKKLFKKTLPTSLLQREVQKQRNEQLSKVEAIS
jgi:hypothetical protein